MKATLFAVVLALGCSKETKSGPAAEQTKPAPVPGDAVAAPPPGYDPGALGALTFSLTEGTPAAREHFQRGLLALHSFWYDEAQREFANAILADRSFNMAHWGLAMSHIKLLWGDDNIAAAKKALSSMPSPEVLGDREQMWVMALIGLLKAPDVRSSRQAFVTALEQLNAQFPDDETATFLAVALLSTIRPEAGDDTAIRQRAAQLARGVYAHNPKHPGAAHYVIHALDTAALANGALDVAKTYAQIAPAAFHAQHMPAHIFARVGMWDDAIKSCEAAWNASLGAAKTHKLSANHHDWHSISWLVEMPFELGHKAEATAWLAKWGDAIKAGLSRQYRGLYASAVASYMARTGEWSRVEELLAPLAAAPMEDGPQLGGMRCGSATAPSSPAELDERMRALDTRAFAAAQVRDKAKATQLIAHLGATFKQLEPTLRAMQPAVVDGLVAAHKARLELLRAMAAGDDRAVVKLLRTSPLSPTTLLSESNPTAFVQDEQVGDVLMRLGDAKGASEAYAKALAEQPGRAHSLLGAARAATKLGDQAAAKQHYAKLVELWVTADAGIDGLTEARAAASAP